MDSIHNIDDEYSLSLNDLGDFEFVSIPTKRLNKRHSTREKVIQSNDLNFFIGMAKYEESRTHDSENFVGWFGVTM